MKYTEKDIKEGTKLRCTKANPRWWKLGKVYTVSLNDDGILHIKDDDGYPAFTSYMLDCLNEEYSAVVFEIVEEEKEMTNYVEITKLMECTPDEKVIEIGKKYKVLYPTLSGVYIYASKANPKYFIYNEQFKYSFESNKEEKEVTKYKYAKITKYAGLGLADEENGLRIGKTYKIVSYVNDLTDDCRIYLNDDQPNYFISETQYELVEKEEPTLKANVNVDVKETIQAKIDSLTTEAEHLFKKRDRLEQHAINLNAKARKLEEVLETIKEFE
ncbi:tail length tape-measure protein [Enterococcus phage vB_EfaS_Ef6.1]|nr:tail length tape-measure protein [Enterococcus phage vB_EfaS_Ef6.1]